MHGKLDKPVRARAGAAGPGDSDAPAHARLSVDEAIAGRRSVRAFTAEPVDAALVAHLLEVAARAPSGTNMQPWRAYALAGSAKQSLCDALQVAHAAAHAAGTPPEAEYRYYPERFFEPYLGRRRKVGWDLYGALGIAKGDHARTHAQHGRNFLFFDAPVGLIFTIDRRLEIGSWLDYGMFLQNIMVAARGARFGDLRPGRLRAVSSGHPGPPRARPDRGGRVRHGPRLRGPDGSGEPDPNRAGRGA